MEMDKARILYNVTVNISDERHDEWVQWMLGHHIAEVLRTGLFIRYKMALLLTRLPEEEGTTYAIQYYLRSQADYDTYQLVYAPALQREALDRFGDAMLAFRTVMELVSEGEAAADDDIEE